MRLNDLIICGVGNGVNDKYIRVASGTNVNIRKLPVITTILSETWEIIITHFIYVQSVIKLDGKCVIADCNYGDKISSISSWIKGRNGEKDKVNEKVRGSLRSSAIDFPPPHQPLPVRFLPRPQSLPSIPSARRHEITGKTSVSYLFCAVDQSA